MDRSADWASCFIYVLHDRCNLRARLRRRFNWRRRRLVFSCFPVIAWNKKEVIFWIKKMLSFFCSSDSWCFNLLPQSFWDSKCLRCQKLRRCFNGYHGCIMAMVVARSFFAYLLTTRFPSAGLSATHVRAGWLLDCSLGAKWARLLITYLAAAYWIHRRLKHNEGWTGCSNCK